MASSQQSEADPLFASGGPTVAESPHRFEERGITLLVPVGESAFRNKQRYLTKEQMEQIRRSNGPQSPLVQQIPRFRNRVEGWNETQRAVMGRHLRTVPER